MPHHQRHAGAPCGVDNVPPLLDRGRDRLFNEDVNLAGDAGERDLMMKVGRRGDGHGIDTFRDQLVQARETAAAGQVVSAGPVRRQRIDDTDQRRIRQTGQHAGMVAAHHACADNPDAKRTFRLAHRARIKPLGTHIVKPRQCFGANITVFS